jgi:lipopolysaccharide transport system ATP-binding protein
MSSDNPAIRIQNLSKCYEIYDRPQDRLKQSIYPRLQRIARREVQNYYREFWALRDVSFEVNRGETVGIIGGNGAGKSTLLQMIAGTLTPTNGKVEVTGRVAALLELGAGFNPEFTGCENVYMNAALLGLSKAEIDSGYDDILAFSDIGDFVDQPVKTYSSGMFVRLAFAIAVHSNPEILIVDEALAVGDMAFQAKCMARLRRMIEAGTTVLFVSHDIGTVKALCSRCLYLDGGKTVRYERAADVVALYVARSNMEINSMLGALPRVKALRSVINADREGIAQSQLLFDTARFLVRTDAPAHLGPEVTRYGDGRVTVFDIKLLGLAGTPVDHLEVDEPFQIQISVRVNADLPDIAWGYSMRDLKGQMLTAMMSTSDPAIGLRPVKAGTILVLAINGKNPLQAGVYTLAIGIELPVMANQHHVFLEVVENALVFKSMWPADASLVFPGIVKVPVEFEVLAVRTEETPARLLA